jgi:hypothetical protein
VIDIAVDEGATRVVAGAEARLTAGDVRGAIDLLSAANRREPSAVLERALVRVRHEGCSALPPPSRTDPLPIMSDPSASGLVEVAAADLDLDSLRRGFARSGCVLVRGLVPAARVAPLVSGIDATFDAYDASVSGGDVDGDWYDPFPMPDTISADSAGAAVHLVSDSPPGTHMPGRAHRKVTRDGFGVWTVDSPRMLFQWFELVDDLGMGDLITEYFGERPFLSANKCTLRRVPAIDEMVGGWHQDGAFLGEHIGAFNLWLALSPCGRDAPGLDIVPRRFDNVLPTGQDAFFKWSLSPASVEAAAGDAIVRPEFEAGDALLFDHRLVHRTGSSADMTEVRYAIESWFYAPSAFPPSQLPIVY